MADEEQIDDQQTDQVPAAPPPPPPGDDQPLQKLYTVVHEQGLYTKSFDEFKTKYSDPKNQDKLYSVVSDPGVGLYTKSKDEFLKKYFSGQPTSGKKNEPAGETLSGAAAEAPFDIKAVARGEKPIQEVTPLEQKRSELGLNENQDPATLARATKYTDLKKQAVADVESPDWKDKIFKGEVPKLTSAPDMPVEAFQKPDTKGIEEYLDTKNLDTRDRYWLRNQILNYASERQAKYYVEQRAIKLKEEEPDLSDQQIAIKAAAGFYKEREENIANRLNNVGLDDQPLSVNAPFHDQITGMNKALMGAINFSGDLGQQLASILEVGNVPGLSKLGYKLKTDADNLKARNVIPANDEAGNVLAGEFLPMALDMETLRRLSAGAGRPIYNSLAKARATGVIGKFAEGAIGGLVVSPVNSYIIAHQYYNNLIKQGVEPAQAASKSDQLFTKNIATDMIMTPLQMGIMKIPAGNWANKALVLGSEAATSGVHFTLQDFNQKSTENPALHIIDYVQNDPDAKRTFLSGAILGALQKAAVDKMTAWDQKVSDNEMFSFGRKYGAPNQAELPGNKTIANNILAAMEMKDTKGRADELKNLTTALREANIYSPAEAARINKIVDDVVAVKPQVPKFGTPEQKMAVFNELLDMRAAEEFKANSGAAEKVPDSIIKQSQLRIENIMKGDEPLYFVNGNEASKDQVLNVVEKDPGVLKSKAVRIKVLNDEVFAAKLQDIKDNGLKPIETNIEPPKTTQNAIQEQGATAVHVPETSSDSQTLGGRNEEEGAINQETSKQKIIEIRHADTKHDEADLVSGQDSVPLSKKGKSVAKKLAKTLEENHDIKKIISSDLPRSMQTAEILSGGKIPVKTRSDLRSWDVGEFSGLKTEDFKAAQKYFVEHPDDHVYEEKRLGETFNQFRDRTIKAREEIEKEKAGTLLVNHSTNMNLWEAFKKNGEWNDQAKADYLDAKTPPSAELAIGDAQDAIFKGRPEGFQDFYNTFKHEIAAVNSSKYDFRIELPDNIGQARREGAVEDIEAGKNTQRTKEFLDALQEHYETGEVHMTRSGGVGTSKIAVPLDVWNKAANEVVKDFEIWEGQKIPDHIANVFDEEIKNVKDEEGEQSVQGVRESGNRQPGSSGETERSETTAANKGAEERIQQNDEEKSGEADQSSEAAEPVSRYRSSNDKPELKHYEQELSKAQAELKSAQAAFDSKRKELDKGLKADQEDLFGERKSAQANTLFDERASAKARDEAMQPLKDRLQNAKEGVTEAQKKLDKASEEPTSQGSLFEEPQTTFDKQVDDIAEKVIDFLTPQSTKGVSKAGIGIDELVRGAAEIIKAAHHAGTNFKEAVEKAIEYMSGKWDNGWGAMPIERLREYFNSLTPIIVRPKTAEELVDEALAIGKQTREEAKKNPVVNPADAKILKPSWWKTLGRMFYDKQDEVTDMKGILRSRQGIQEHALDVIFKASNKMRDFWNTISTKKQLQFILGVERPELLRNQPQDVKDMAAVYRTRLDKAFALIRENLPNLNFIEDYFPHFWKKPEEVKNYFANALGKAPLEGGKSFSKRRFYDTILEGLKKGYELTTTNPEELVRLAEMNAWKFTTAKDIFKDMQRLGYLKYSTAEDVPASWKTVDDKLFNRIGAYVDPVGNAKATAGSYMMPPEIARLMNNYLSPGIKGPVKNAISNFNNIKNLFQLGAGFYHFVTTGIENSVIGNSIAIQDLTRGNLIGAAKNFISNTPITLGLPGLYSSLKRGFDTKRDYNKGLITNDVQALIDANAKIGRQKMYSLDTYYNMKKAFGRLRADGDFKQIPKVLWNAALFVPESINKILMEKWVPALKVGAYLKSLDAEIAARKNMDPRALQQAKEKSWDSSDDKLGQVVYDNVFINKSFKDLLFMAIRSAGWTGGTIRSVVKGVAEIPLSVNRFSKGQGISQRTAYLFSLPLTVGLMGGMFQLIMTGEPPGELKDYFFPKDGSKNPDGSDHRVSLPSYLKDILAYSKSFLRTLSHKTAPALNEAVELYDNKDFYGEKIYNENDPIYQQGLDALKYEAQTMVPFSLKQNPTDTQPFTEQFSNRQGWEQKFGVMAAPKERERTDVQNEIIKAFGKQMGHEVEGRTHEKLEETIARRHLREYIYNGGTWRDADEEMKQKANVKEVDRFITESKMDPYERYFKELKKETRQKLFDEMSVEDQDQYRKYLK